MPRERKATNKDGYIIEDGYFPKNALSMLKKNTPSNNQKKSQATKTEKKSK